MDCHWQHPLGVCGRVPPLEGQVWLTPVGGVRWAASVVGARASSGVRVWIQGWRCGATWGSVVASLAPVGVRWSVLVPVAPAFQAGVAVRGSLFRVAFLGGPFCWVWSGRSGWGRGGGA